MRFYYFFKFIDKEEITKKNIINISNTNEIFKNILSHFDDLKYIYKIIIHFCKEINDRTYYSEFIKITNKLISKNIPYFFKYYLTNSEEKLNKIFHLILLFSEEDFGNINLKNDIIKDNIINKLISDKDFTIYFLKGILIQKLNNVNNSFIYYFFEIIFNSEFDLDDFINKNKANIKKLLDNINYKEIDGIIKITKKINLKNISELFDIIKEYPLKYIFTDNTNDIIMAQINNKIPIEYFNIFYFFADNYKNINILSQRKSYTLGNIKYMIKTNLLFFLNDWDKSYDFTQFINEVENDILIFSKLLIIDNSTKEENCLKINFFF